MVKTSNLPSARLPFGKKIFECLRPEDWFQKSFCILYVVKQKKILIYTKYYNIPISEVSLFEWISILRTSIRNYVNISE